MISRQEVMCSDDETKVRWNSVEMSEWMFCFKYQSVTILPITINIQLFLWFLRKLTLEINLVDHAEFWFRDKTLVQEILRTWLIDLSCQQEYDCSEDSWTKNTNLICSKTWQDCANYLMNRFQVPIKYLKGN